MNTIIDEFKYLLQTHKQTYKLYEEFTHIESILDIVGELLLSKYQFKEDDDDVVYYVRSAITPLNLINYKDFIQDNFLLFDFVNDIKTNEYKIPHYMNNNTKYILLHKNYNNISILFDINKNKFNLSLTLRYE